MKGLNYIIDLTYFLGVKPFRKKVVQRKEFYDGVTKTVFEEKDQAKNFFYKMSKSGILKGELNVGEGTIYEYSKGEKAENLFKNFMKSLEEYEKKKPRGLKINYKIVKGGN